MVFFGNVIQDQGIKNNSNEDKAIKNGLEKPSRFKTLKTVHPFPTDTAEAITQ